MILHVNGRFYGQAITGVQRYARELVAAIDHQAAAGHLTAPFERVVAHLPQGVEPAPGLAAVEVQHHGPGNGHPWEQLVLPRAARGGILFCPGNVAPIRSLYSGRVVVTIHDLSFRYFPEAYSLPYRAWYRALTPLIMRRAIRIITVSESERAAITRIYPAVTGRLRAIQNGGAPVVPPSGPPPAPDPYVLYIGSLTRRKNFPGVLQAFALLAARRPDLRLVVAGAASRTFATTGASAAPGDRISYLGQVEDAGRLAAAYRGARCLLFPSFYEASPLPPTEAMANGCPVVAGDIPSLRERCADAALYCDPHDPATIAAQAERILDDEALAADLRRRGAARAATFTWEAAAVRTLAVLAEAACA